MKLTGVDIRKSFEGKRVLRDVSFEIHHGEAAALTGASGIGKTTLLRLMLGLETPDGGELIREQRDGAFLPPGRMAYAGCVFQEDRLMEDISAVENLQAALAGGGLFLPRGLLQKEKGGRGSESRRAVIEKVLLELLPGDSLNQPVKELSGGMRRRLCLARACLCPAEWLVLDEPFTGLDDSTRKQAIRFLRRYRGDRTLLMATHSLADLRFDQVLELRE